MTAFLFFLLGLVLLLLGSRGIVQNALSIASRLRISPLTIGITVVAIGTSLPEIVISLFGGLDKATDLALGNIVGSNIANIGLIFGLILTFHSLYIGRTKTQKNMLLYLLLTPAFFLLLIFGQLKFFSGIIFLIWGFSALYWQIIQGQKGAEEEDKEVIAKLAKVRRNPMLAGILFIVSLGIVISGGKLLVDNGIEIARFFNVSQVIIGITVVAIGTSLPELAVSIAGLAAKEEKLVVGNILGSNIFNILFGGGILGSFGAGGLDNYASLILFVIFSFFFCFLIYKFKGQTVPRYFGPTLLFIYGAYLGLTFV